MSTKRKYVKYVLFLGGGGISMGMIYEKTFISVRAAVARQEKCIHIFSVNFLQKINGNRYIIRFVSCPWTDLPINDLDLSI